MTDQASREAFQKEGIEISPPIMLDFVYEIYSRGYQAALTQASTEMEKIRKRVAELEVENKALGQIGEVWRKTAYELSGVTEEDVRKHLEALPPIPKAEG